MAIHQPPRIVYSGSPEAKLHKQFALKQLGILRDQLTVGDYTRPGGQRTVPLDNNGSYVHCLVGPLVSSVKIHVEPRRRGYESKTEEQGGFAYCKFKIFDIEGKPLVWELVDEEKPPFKVYVERIDHQKKKRWLARVDDYELVDSQKFHASKEEGGYAGTPTPVPGKCLVAFDGETDEWVVDWSGIQSSFGLIATNGNFRRYRTPENKLRHIVTSGVFKVSTFGKPTAEQSNDWLELELEEISLLYDTNDKRTFILDYCGETLTPGEVVPGEGGITKDGESFFNTRVAWGIPAYLVHYRKPPAGGSVEDKWWQNIRYHPQEHFEKVSASTPIRWLFDEEPLENESSVEKFFDPEQSVDQVTVWVRLTEDDGHWPVVFFPGKGWIKHETTLSFRAPIFGTNVEVNKLSPLFARVVSKTYGGEVTREEAEPNSYYGNFNFDFCCGTGSGDETDGCNNIVAKDYRVSGCYPHTPDEVQYIAEIDTMSAQIVVSTRCCAQYDYFKANGSWIQVDTDLTKLAECKEAVDVAITYAETSGDVDNTVLEKTILVTPSETTHSLKDGTLCISDKTLEQNITGEAVAPYYDWYSDILNRACPAPVYGDPDHCYRHKMIEFLRKYQTIPTIA